MIYPQSKAVDMEELSGNKRHFYPGFDYLRVIMIAAVIAGHAQLTLRFNAFDINQYQFPHYHVTILNVIGENLLALAVPTFFIVSLFLFFTKVQDSRSYFRPRMVRLLYLYGFWVVLWLLHRGGFSTFASDVRHGDIYGAVEFVVRGGYSEFYFLFSLIFLTFIAYFSVRLPKSVLWLLLGLSLSLLWLFPLVTIHYGSYHSLVALWSPMNFLPYIFIANLGLHYLQDGNVRWSSSRFKIGFFTILILTIVSAIGEWLWLPNQVFFEANPGNVIPPYTRFSVAGGASLVFLLSFLVKKPAWRWVRFIAGYTIGLFCLNVFVISIYKSIFGAPVSFDQKLILFAATVLISLITAYLARRAFTKRLI